MDEPRINKSGRFNSVKFDDENIGSQDEQIFHTFPIKIFQVECLEEVLHLCGWKKTSLANLLNVSDSTVNNILANDSMTNANPTCLTRCQFLSLLFIIQSQKVKKEKKSLIVFYLFSHLCSGLRGEFDSDKYNQLYELESSKLDRTLFFKVINNLCPDLFHSFNLFMEWQFNSPNTSMSEFYGGGKDEDRFHPWFENLKREPEDAEINKAMKYVDKFIPKYLEWYVSQFTKYC